MPASTSKYSEEKEKKLLDALRETGSAKSAWKAAGITKATYYNWLNAHPSLVKKVKKAIDEFERTVAVEWKSEALSALEKYLTGKHKVVSVYTVEKTEDVIDSETGLPCGQKTTRENRKVVTTPAPPQWAIERVLGRNLDLSGAIETFTRYGYRGEQTDTGYIFTDTYLEDGEDA